MKTFKLILGAIIVISFMLLGIKTIVDLDKQVELKEIQFKSIDSQLNEKKVESDKLKNQLNEAKNKNNLSSEEVKKLQDKLQILEKENADLEQKVQAKIDSKNRLAKASKDVINAATGTKSVAATSGNCDLWMSEAGINHPAAREIIKRESRCEPCIYNDGSPTGKIDCNYKGSNACGIPQSLPCSKVRDVAGCGMTNPVCQLKWMASYIAGKYGTWDNAIDHHNKVGWY